MHLARQGEMMSPRSCWFVPAEVLIQETEIPVLLPPVLDSIVSKEQAYSILI
jgi:hypothetical protein